MNLWLTVERGDDVLESGVVAWSGACTKRILPKRVPDYEDDKSKRWMIPFDRRRAFGVHADKVLSTKSSCTAEELYGFFALVGMGSRWADRDDVIWGLHFGDDEYEPGKD